MGGAGLRRITGRRGPGGADPGRRRAGHAGTAWPSCRAWLPALLDRQGQARTNAVVAAALAGTFRPRRLADDSGLLVVDDLAGCTCGVDRHLDLSQPAAPVPTAADRPVRSPAASIQLAAVRL